MGAEASCRRRGCVPLSDLGVEPDEYPWEGLMDYRITEYENAKDVILERYSTDSRNPENELDHIEAVGKEMLRLFLLRRAIALVHVLKPLQEGRATEHYLRSQGAMSQTRWTSFQQAEQLCANEVKLVSRDFQLLSEEGQTGPSVVQLAANLYHLHGMSWPWPKGVEDRLWEVPEHPCPAALPLASPVVWIGAETSENHQKKLGVVISGVAEDDTRVVVRFGEDVQQLPLAELRKPLGKPADVQPDLPKPFKIGQKVHFIAGSTDIDEMEPGEVIGPGPNSNIQVKFMKGLCLCSPQQLAIPHEDANDISSVLEQLQVPLRREPGESLGIVLNHLDESALLVKEILDTGYQHKHNAALQNPALQVRPGDRVMAVIDASVPESERVPVGGNSHAMLEVITRDKNRITPLIFVITRLLGPPLRFKVGQRVKANCGDQGWGHGTVVAVWTVGNGIKKPYAIKMDSANIVMAPADSDICVVRGDPRFSVGDTVMARRSRGYEKGVILEVQSKANTFAYRMRMMDQTESIAPEDLDIFVRPVARFAVGDKVFAQVNGNYEPGLVDAVYHPKWTYAVKLESGNVVIAPEDHDRFVKKR